MNFLNPVHVIGKKLPSKSKYLLVDSVSPQGKEKKLFVNSRRLTSCLQWLSANNPFYSQIEIDTSNYDEDSSHQIDTPVEANVLEEQLECLYNTSKYNYSHSN
ncbi:MAG: hypothetical protein MHMPM18_004764 [Marteilia pararefringens]